MSGKYELSASPMAPQLFGNAARDYYKKYNLPQDDTLAKIAYKNHKHSVNNPCVFEQLWRLAGFFVS